MAVVIPKSRAKKLLFFQLHRQQWLDHAAELNLPAEELAEMEALLALAEEKYALQQQLQQAARAATLGFNATLDALGEIGARLVRRIKVAADTNEKAYYLAQIAGPDGPSAVAPPGRPTQIEAQLAGNSGAVRLTWQCRNPRSSAGTVYQVARRVDHAGAFEDLGFTGKPEFVDETIPRGAGEVTYRITAVRSTAVGVPALFTMRLYGDGAGGAATPRFGDSSQPRTFIPSRRRRGMAA